MDLILEWCRQWVSIYKYFVAAVPPKCCERTLTLTPAAKIEAYQDVLRLCDDRRRLDGFSVRDVVQHILHLSLRWWLKEFIDCVSCGCAVHWSIAEQTVWSRLLGESDAVAPESCWKDVLPLFRSVETETALRVALQRSLSVSADAPTLLADITFPRAVYFMANKCLSLERVLQVQFLYLSQASEKGHEVVSKIVKAAFSAAFDRCLLASNDGTCDSILFTAWLEYARESVWLTEKHVEPCATRSRWVASTLCCLDFCGLSVALSPFLDSLEVDAAAFGRTLADRFLSVGSMPAADRLSTSFEDLHSTIEACRQRLDVFFRLSQKDIQIMKNTACDLLGRRRSDAAFVRCVNAMVTPQDGSNAGVESFLKIALRQLWEESVKWESKPSEPAKHPLAAVLSLCEFSSTLTSVLERLLPAIVLDAAGIDVDSGETLRYSLLALRAAKRSVELLAPHSEVRAKFERSVDSGVTLVLDQRPETIQAMSDVLHWCVTIAHVGLFSASKGVVSDALLLVQSTQWSLLELTNVASLITARDTFIATCEAALAKRLWILHGIGGLSTNEENDVFDHEVQLLNELTRSMGAAAVTPLRLLLQDCKRGLVVGNTLTCPSSDMDVEIPSILLVGESRWRRHCIIPSLLLTTDQLLSAVVSGCVPRCFLLHAERVAPQLAQRVDSGDSSRPRILRWALCSGHVVVHCHQTHSTLPETVVLHAPPFLVMVLQKLEEQCHRSQQSSVQVTEIIQALDGIVPSQLVKAGLQQLASFELVRRLDRGSMVSVDGACRHRKVRMPPFHFSQSPQVLPEKIVPQQHQNAEHHKQIEACIVKIMKRLKRCSHKVLWSEVMETTRAPRVAFDPAVFKNIIADLINREFLSRTHVENEAGYEYVA